MFLRNLFVSHPRRAVFLIAILVVALVAGVYAYIVSLQPQRGPLVSITSPPVEFSMELNKAEYQYGENITITFLLENISNQTMQFTKLSKYGAPIYNIFITEVEGVNNPQGIGTLFHFDFSITDANGTQVYRWSLTRVAAQATYDIFFEPYGHIKQTLVWDYDYGHYGGNMTLPKGTYQIRAVLYKILINRGGSWSTPAITLETPSITFMIK